MFGLYCWELYFILRRKKKMGEFVPPYINKHTEQLKKELDKAVKKEEQAKMAYEAAKEYTELCREAYEKSQG